MTVHDVAYHIMSIKRDCQTVSTGQQGCVHRLLAECLVGLLFAVLWSPRGDLMKRACSLFIHTYKCGVASYSISNSDDTLSS
mmetsp:Transcript_9456/g.15784  ORF Transcript_9456/g.15784 Transcript_9456/m.15784 type:complete len:82 (+) Transcript_9456:944-1189(+)